MGDIREYRPDDEPACLDIFDSNRPKYFAGPERDLFAAYLRRKDRPYFVAEVLGQVRGCGGFHIDDYGVSYLDWGMVHADWHRRGVGAHLLEWRLERIRQIAHAWCVLIDTSQHTAPFFARFGFEPFRVIADGYQPGLDKVFMRLVWSARISTSIGRAMAEFPKRLTDSSDGDRLVRASEEYFDKGVSSVLCDQCGKPIQFRELSPTAWEHECSCGKYNGTMKGL